MKTICITGLGVISRNHHFGLTNNPNFRLTGACDIRDDAVGRRDYAAVPFFDDNREMIDRLRPDFVVITTPPATHAANAIETLEMGCSVIVEKPATIRTAELAAIKETADRQKLYFETAFHWQYGFEALHAAGILQNYGRIEKITVSIQDPYSADGVSIDGNKLGLCGTFLDSGSNAVSLLYELVDFSRFELLTADCVNAANAELPLYSRHRFTDGAVEAVIEIDWRENINSKVTRIRFEGGGEMRIDHSGQSVYYADELIYRNDRFERLTAHYCNYYNMFDASPARSERLYAIASRITDIWEETNHV